jgi:GxxExxY protein
MPIDCPITLPRLSEDEMREIDYTVMGHVFATHRELGRLCDESVYQHKLLHRLQAAGIKAAIEVPVTVSHRDFAIRLKLDLVVQQRVVYELKTASSLAGRHKAQLLVYLFLTNATRGKLVNLRTKSVESHFVNTSLDHAERRRCRFDMSGYQGDGDLEIFVRDLVADWGTGLHPSIYRRAILKCMGNQTVPERMLPMTSCGHRIGRQRFHLLDAKTALGVTTFSTPTTDNLDEFEKLVAVSPLRELHWVNIAHHQVTLNTIRKGRNT